MEPATQPPARRPSTRRHTNTMPRLGTRAGLGRPSCRPSNRPFQSSLPIVIFHAAAEGQDVAGPADQMPFLQPSLIRVPHFFDLLKFYWLGSSVVERIRWLDLAAADPANGNSKFRGRYCMCVGFSFSTWSAKGTNHREHFFLRQLAHAHAGFALVVVRQTPGFFPRQLAHFPRHPARALAVHLVALPIVPSSRLLIFHAAAEGQGVVGPTDQMPLLRPSLIRVPHFFYLLKFYWLGSSVVERVRWLD